MNAKLYRCKICGKIIVILKDSDADTICCGRQMEELVPGVTDGAVEKHVPFVKQNGSTVVVEIGCEPHPAKKEHHIEWIILQTDKGFQFKSLNCEESAVAKFELLDDEKVICAWEYCNLHGLWKS